MNERISIEKQKVGTWKPRTYYWALVDGDYVGRYETSKDARRAAEEHLRDKDRRLKDQDQELAWEFDLGGEG